MRIFQFHYYLWNGHSICRQTKYHYMFHVYTIKEDETIVLR